MDDAFVVRAGETFGDLRPNFERATGRQHAARQHVAQLLAANQLHGHEAHAVRFIDLVDDRDMWMLERRCRAGFLYEALPALGIGDELRGQNLQRDLAAEASVERAIHDTHPAAADLFDDFVVRERPADQGHARILPGFARELRLKADTTS